MTSSKGFAIVLMALTLFGGHHAVAQWQKVLSCDDGKAWVDVDTNERHHLQLVIRNKEANQYLDRILGVAGLSSVSGGDWERVYSGSQANALTGDAIEAGTKTRFAGQGGTAIPLERDNSRYATDFNEHLVFKKDGAGLKIEFTRTDINQCYAYYGRFGKCDDRGTFHVDKEYRGNWFFQGCQTVQ